MSSPQRPDDQDIRDAVWVEFGASHPGHARAPLGGNAAPATDSPAVRVARQVVGCLVLVAVVGCCDFLVVARWDIRGPSWRVIVYAVVAALGGAVTGFLLTYRYPLPGLLAGACSGAGSVSAAAWASDRLGSPDPAIAGVVALAGLIPGVGAYYVVRRLADRMRPAKGGSESVAAPGQVLGPPTAPAAPRPCPADATLAAVFASPPKLRDPQEAQLDDRLLHLCKENRHLFDRLLHHEWARHPELRRVDLLRLAVEHFEKDNR